MYDIKKLLDYALRKGIKDEIMFPIQTMQLTYFWSVVEQFMVSKGQNLDIVYENHYAICESRRMGLPTP